MKKLILSLCILISIRAYAEPKEYSVIAACNYGLGFFTTEGGCLAVWHKSDVLDLGIRANHSQFGPVYKRISAIAEWHPFFETFYIEGGVGYFIKTCERNDSCTNRTGLVVSAQFGNRWVLLNGFTIGLNYAGYSTNGSFLVISPEIGLAF